MKKSYIEIPTSILVQRVDLQMPPLPSIAFYLEMGGKPQCIREADRPFSPLVLSRHKTVWVRQEDFPALKAYTENFLLNPAMAASMPVESRMRLLHHSAAVVTDEIFQNPNPETIMKGITLVGSFVHVLMKEPEAFRFLAKLSSQSPRLIQHAMATATQCIILARKIGIQSPEELQEIGTAGLLHDIGQTKIPRALLEKTSELTAEERRELQKHVELGHEMIRNIGKIPGRTKRAILEHHEFLDGSGYPSGKTADQIDLFSRILTVCNLFTDLTIDSPRSRALSVPEAFERLQKDYASKVDSALLSQMMSIYGKSAAAA